MRWLLCEPSSKSSKLREQFKKCTLNLCHTVHVEPSTACCSSVSASWCVSDSQGTCHEDPWAANHGTDLQIWENCLYRSQEVSLPVCLDLFPVTVVLLSVHEPPISSLCSGELSRLGARRFARKLQKLGYPTRFLNFRIHNLVATCATFPLNLELLAFHQRCRSGDTGCVSMNDTWMSYWWFLREYMKLMISLAQRLRAGQNC